MLSTKTKASCRLLLFLPDSPQTQDMAQLSLAWVSTPLW